MKYANDALVGLADLGVWGVAVGPQRVPSGILRMIVIWLVCSMLSFLQERKVVLFSSREGLITSGYSQEPLAVE